MADNYLEFSEMLSNLTLEEYEWLQDQLEVVHVVDGIEYEEAKVPENVDGVWIGCRAFRDMADYETGFCEGAGFNYELSDKDDKATRHLWIYSEDFGNLDHVAHLVQKLLRKFRPRESWSLTYSGTCSKPRVGEFGGGAVFVTADQVEYFTAEQWIVDRKRAFENISDEPLLESIEGTDVGAVLKAKKCEAPQPSPMERYVSAGGTFCPHCQSEQIEGGPADFNAGQCTQEMWCIKCQARWTDVYKLSGIAK